MATTTNSIIPAAEGGISTMSMTERDDRIAARRQRREEKQAMDTQKGKIKNKGDAQDAEEMGLGEQQVANSLVNLDTIKSGTVESVTSIRVEADHFENLRRIKEEENRQSRLQSLQDEAVNSGKQNAAIEMRWAELMEHNMPQELMREMNEQIKACEEINRSKDILIKRFKEELKHKDEEYVKSQKMQAEDIEMLLERMSKQYDELQGLYAQELGAVEQAFLQERQELLEANKKELDNLFEKRRTMEMRYMEAKQEREEQYRKELDDLRAKDAEDYNQLKIKLETDIQVLEQQLEEMRATYQLNTEKLEYNYRVLTERDMENSATLGQQKRKLARLKDALSTLTAKYHQTDRKFKQENVELTDEYRRLTKQYKDLQAKFKHFEVADNRKYQEVWDMHQEEVLEMVDKLLQAERTISEQQLGLPWTAPDRAMFQHGVKNGMGGNPVENIAVTTEEHPNHAESKLSPESSPETPRATTRSKVSNAKIKLMLEMLSAEAGFLVDPRLKEQLESLGKEQAAVLRADSILKALGVSDEQDIQTLMSFFFDKADDDEEDAFALELAKTEEERLQSLGLKISEDDVVRVVKAFVDERNARNASDEATISQQQQQQQDANMKYKRGNGGDHSKNDTLQLKEKYAKAQRERDRREESAYWKRLANIVPERTFRIWSTLEQGLHKYNVVLQERAALVDDVLSLEQQNRELKALLKQYLGSKVIEELKIPPTHLIRIERGRERKNFHQEPGHT